MVSVQLSRIPRDVSCRTLEKAFFSLWCRQHVLYGNQPIVKVLSQHTLAVRQLQSRLLNVQTPIANPTAEST